MCFEVVDTVDLEDIGKKKIFCRCWNSKKVFDYLFFLLFRQSFSLKKFSKSNKTICKFQFKFPLCDGSHVEHNKKTGDNVGPLIVEGKQDWINHCHFNYFVIVIIRKIVIEFYDIYVSHASHKSLDGFVCLIR